MFDLRIHSGKDSGKPKSIRRAGLPKPVIEQYLDYQLEFTTRPASPISTRTTYAVRIDGGEPLLQTYLTGFQTEKQARQAAYAEVERLEVKYGSSVSPIANILTSLKKQRAAKKNRDNAA